jgi:metal-responsive CopG/Arc/MetJ family transcriptional regulator
MRLEQTLLKRLDNFRFKQRFASRTAAIKWLLEAALKAKLAPGPDEVN